MPAFSSQNIQFERIKVTKEKPLSASLLRSWKELIRCQTGFVHPLCFPDYCQCLSKVRNDVEIATATESGQLVAMIVFHKSGVGAIDIGDATSDQSVLLVRPGACVDWNQFFQKIGLYHWKFTHLQTIPSQLESSIQLWDDSFQVNLQDGWDAYRNGLREKGSKLESELNRKLRRLEKDYGPVEFKFHNSQKSAKEFLIHEKDAQLRRQYGDSILQNHWVCQLIEGLQGNADGQDFGVLSTLEVGDRLVAAHLGMKAEIEGRSTFNSWIPVANPEFSRYSPGSLIFWKILQQGSELGIEYFDLGRGENQLKRRFSNQRQPMAVGRFGVNWKWSIYSRLEGWLRFAKKHLAGFQQLPKRVFRFS